MPFTPRMPICCAIWWTSFATKCAGWSRKACDTFSSTLLTIRTIWILTSASDCGAAGFDPDKELERAIAGDKAALHEVPRGKVTVALHVCRGNSRSRWYTEGGYDRNCREAVSARLDVDAFLLEYDSDRSGSFEPLRLVPRNKTVVLGLVTTKEAKLESQDELRRRIDEAARYRSARKSGAESAVRLRIGGGGQSAIDRRSVAQAGTGSGDGPQSLGQP